MHNFDSVVVDELTVAAKRPIDTVLGRGCIRFGLTASCESYKPDPGQPVQRLDVGRRSEACAYDSDANCHLRLPRARGDVVGVDCSVDAAAATQ